MIRHVLVDRSASARARAPRAGVWCFPRSLWKRSLLPQLRQLPQGSRVAYDGTAARDLGSMNEYGRAYWGCAVNLTSVNLSGRTPSPRFGPGRPGALLPSSNRTMLAPYFQAAVAVRSSCQARRASVKSRV